MIEQFYSTVNRKFKELSSSEKKIINEVWEHTNEFIQWPVKARLLWPGCVRVRESYKYSDEIKNEAKSKRVPVDSRQGNGPAIMSFLLAGGRRPKRSNNQGWHIDHIYNGKFPWRTDGKTLHAVKDGKHFTQSAGLVSVHPIAEALSDEYFYFAWLVRCESFKKFSYDPDMVFCNKTDKFGFKTS